VRHTLKKNKKPETYIIQLLATFTFKTHGLILHGKIYRVFISDIFDSDLADDP
jgi:hypothetical protein